MDTKNKKLIIAGIVVGVIIVTFGVLACVGLFRGFDPQAYAKAMLDQTMKGEVEVAAQMVDGATEQQLLAQYEENIITFTKKNILNNVEVGKELEEKYIAQCKNIFAGMKYEVGEAKEVGDKEYQIPVTYQASDVYVKYMAALAKENQRLTAKMEKGDYKGESREEIEKQMQAEFLENACALLEEAYKTMEFSEKQTITFTIKKGENGLYKLQEGEMTQFIVKIMSLDAIQG